MQSMNHGGSWSLYFLDLEGNTIELSLSGELICQQTELIDESISREID